MAAADDDLRARVGALEAAVTGLRADVARLAAQLAAHRRDAPEAPRPAPERAPSSALPRAAPPDPAPDIEGLVGRYGVLALGALTTLAAVGTFVSWAIVHGLLGPTTRVVLGLVLAAALTGAGLRLRARERSFGSALLALALAVVHVCAWAAGPGLHLVADREAFVLAALASAALAAFAYLEREQPLWCIGVGGAAVAPFVTSERSGSLVLLASYGAAVAIAGAAGIAGRRWRYAALTVVAIVAVYAIVLAIPGAPPDWGPLLALAVPAAVALGGVFPATSADLIRPRLRSQGLLAAAAAAWVSERGTPLGAEWTAALLAAGGVLWLAMADRTADAAAAGPLETPMGFVPPWTDGAVIPLAFVAAAAHAGPLTPWWPAGVWGAAALVLAGSVWRRAAGMSRDALAFACAAAAFAAAVLAPWHAPIAYPVAEVAVGLACAAALRWRPSYSWLDVGGLALVVAAANTWTLIDRRPPFLYAPFGTRESLAAAVVLGAWGLVGWRAAALAGSLRGALARDPARADHDGAVVRAAARAAPWTWAFLWAHAELAGAWSASLATLLLVSLEAGTAVAAVGVGRARGARALRQVGLALAVVAAIRALAAVDSVRSVSVRIASYLVASAFLLGIAYWYRRRGPDPVADEAAAARVRDG